MSGIKKHKCQKKEKIAIFFHICSITVEYFNGKTTLAQESRKEQATDVEIRRPDLSNSKAPVKRYTEFW
jgi:hypothetical protein